MNHIIVLRSYYKVFKSFTSTKFAPLSSKHPANFVEPVRPLHLRLWRLKLGGMTRGIRPLQLVHFPFLWLYSSMFMTSISESDFLGKPRKKASKSFLVDFPRVRWMLSRSSCGPLLESYLSVDRHLANKTHLLPTWVLTHPMVTNIDRSFVQRK